MLAIQLLSLVHTERQLKTMEVTQNGLQLHYGVIVLVSIILNETNIASITTALTLH